ncbi:membrane protein [Desulfatibacillum alkenivorans DSM 16219]|jgi:membrane protein|uniref:Membrane protein n=1 Tax=Desulfatibacillum alkenivorans DSM 16219 TaxID=1121393 RepID=A0A1M6RFI5_9BACT|nr:YihY/virulence factor BrkB family protein [Desulfatibacillum alkenivorans]SHK31251.1 membrane protein [Desulfatibacillum alkenivorans DSM 16219]
MNGILQKLVHQPYRFFKQDLWEIKTRSLPRYKALGVRFLRVPALAVNDFLRDNCWMRASALTYYSLLGIVPLLAMIMGIARGMGFEARIEELLLHEFGGQELVLTKVLEFAKAMLSNTKGGVVNGLWMLLLLWTVIRLFGNIEMAFNQIWGFAKGRSQARKVIDYLAVALLMPVLWLPASSAQVLIASQIEAYTQWAFLQNVGDIIQFTLLFFLPFAMIWVLFSCLYIFMPNGSVSWTSGIVAGIVAGSAFQLFQRFYIEFQVGVARNNAIYGSFAALPLFLIWLYMSWVIVLFGAEIAFAHQHSRDNDFSPTLRKTSFFLKKYAALQIMELIVHSFTAGDGQHTEDQISYILDLPRSLTAEVLAMLQQAGLVVPVKSSNKHPAYLPGMDPDALTTQLVLERLEQVGTSSFNQTENPIADNARDALDHFSQAMKQSPANKPFKTPSKEED